MTTYNNAISTLEKAGIINGDGNGLVRPNDAITRAEFAKLAAVVSSKNLTNLPEVSFSDVAEDAWYNEYIAIAEAAGLISGYTDGTFKPEQPITRAEAMTIINRLLERAVTVEELEQMKGQKYYNEWPDNTPDKWYYCDVQEATNSHEYVRTGKIVPGHDYHYEDWLKVLPVPDWAALERTWSSGNEVTANVD